MSHRAPRPPNELEAAQHRLEVAKAAEAEALAALADADGSADYRNSTFDERNKYLARHGFHPVSRRYTR